MWECTNYSATVSGIFRFCSQVEVEQSVRCTDRFGRFCRNVNPVLTCHGEQRAKPKGDVVSSLSIYIPTLTYGHELWVEPKRKLSQRKVATNISFWGMADLIGVRSLVTWERSGYGHCYSTNKVYQGGSGIQSECLSPPRGGVSGMYSGEEALGLTQDLLEILYPSISPRKLQEVLWSGRSGNLRLLSGWMIQYNEIIL